MKDIAVGAVNDMLERYTNEFIRDNNINVEPIFEKLREWLGKDGIRFFQLLHSFHDSVMPTLRLNQVRKGLPAHPVHFREGMQIRNFLRSLPECEGWDQLTELDDIWSTLVTRAIGR